MQTIIIAVGAFLGATIAQVASHFLQIRRDSRAGRKKSLQLFDAVREELRLAIREAYFLVHGIEEIRGGHHRFRSDPGVPRFQSIIASQLKPDDPINPRVIVTLAMAYSELAAVSNEIRAAGNKKRLSKHTVIRTTRSFNYLLSVYAAFMKADDSDHIPYSYEVSDDDKQKALTLIGLLDDDAFLKVPHLDHLGWVHIDEDKVQDAPQKG